MRNEEHQNYYVQLTRERITQGMHVSMHTAGIKLSFLILQRYTLQTSQTG